MVGSFESNKDIVQDLTEQTANRVGNIAKIITGAVKDVAKEIGDLVTDGIEMRDASKKAREDGTVDAEVVD
jgi:ribosomal protein S17E